MTSVQSGSADPADHTRADHADLVRRPGPADLRLRVGEPAVDGPDRAVVPYFVPGNS